MNSNNVEKFKMISENQEKEFLRYKKILRKKSSQSGSKSNDNRRDSKSNDLRTSHPTLVYHQRGGPAAEGGSGGLHRLKPKCSKSI